MASASLDAITYAYRALYNKHTHTTGAQAPAMGLPPDSIGYCPWCHELVPCWKRDWDRPDGPECGQPVDRGEGKHSWCANHLRPLTGCLGEHPAGRIIEAAFILGGTNAAVAVWREHGHPALASRF